MRAQRVGAHVTMVALMFAACTSGNSSSDADDLSVPPTIADEVHNPP
jgi:hypothetical protein